MSRMLPAVAAGALIAVAAITAVVLLRPTPDPTAAERAASLLAELRCPDCQGLSVADSPTRTANEIRRQVDELLAAGATDDEVRAHFVDRYGEWILLAPASPVAWLTPLVVVVAGLVGIVVWLARRDRSVVPVAPASDADRRSLREEVEALDA